MRPALPSGTVTFLFTDVQGSTKLLHELGAERYADALAEHRRIVREACIGEGGVEVDTQGDAFFFAFPTAPGALAAAASFTDALASSGPISVRVGIHTGTPLLAAEGYVGTDVHRAARIGASGHGGQVLVSSSTASLLEHELRDLGEHRFKDLSAPERVYQLGEGEFPPLKSLHRTNLPVPASPFLGREAELADVVRLLTKDDLRLLTLTGPGGTGKTRLALQAAAEASESFPDGVFWVPLAPLRDPALVLSSIARTLSVSEEPGRALADTLLAHLSGKRLLLFLDNVEHLLPGVASPIAGLRSANGSRLLLTSRERLRIGGEQAWPVPPLASEDGRALFLSRALALDPAFTPTLALDELCRRLDQLPLAIELAAARTAVFSAEQLLERLSGRLDLLKGERDADPRQQTLRATIEWSHELLSPEEQTLFAHLSVFAGGCTYEDAEVVAGADPDTLQSLLDKSLLRKRDSPLGPRYWMLETIREYAAERLEDSGEVEELRRRHRELFLALAEEGPFVLMDASWAEHVDHELDNVRAALDLGAAAGESERVLRAAASLGDFWFTRGHIVEGRTRLENALRSDTEPTAARCLALVAASRAGVIAGANAPARAHLDEALSLAGSLGDPYLTALARLQDAWLLTEDERWSEAIAILDDVVPVLRELGAWDVAIPANRSRAWAYEELGDSDRFWALTVENLEHARAHGHRRIEARSLGALADLAVDEGRLDDARELFVQSLEIDLELGNVPFVGLDLVRFAVLHTRNGNPRLAARLVARALATFDEIGLSLESWMARIVDQATAGVRAELDEATFEAACEDGRALSLDEAVELALTPLH